MGSTAVEWLAPEEITARMTELYAIRLLDALDDKGPTPAATPTATYGRSPHDQGKARGRVR